MQKVNEIFGKEVINQVNGEKIATVHDVVLDRDSRHIIALLIRGSGLLAPTQVVRWERVVSMGDVVVVRADPPLPVLKDDPEVEELTRQANRITGTSVISDKGEQLGSIGDMFVDEQGQVIGYEVKQGLLHSNRYLAIEYVQATGKDAIISTLTELPRVKDLGTENHVESQSPTSSEEESASHG